MANGDLSQVLNRPMEFPYAYSPEEGIGRISRGSDITGRASAARQELPRIAEAESGASKAMLEAEQKQRVEGARARAKAEREYAERARKTEEEFTAMAPAAPEFNPTQFNPGAMSLGAGLVGLIFGFGAKDAGRSVMKSMKGFVEGAEKGQADVYSRELRDFDQKMKSWKDNMSMTEKRLGRIMEQYGRDRAAALVDAKLLETELGEGVISAKLRLNDLKGAREAAQKAIDTANQIELEVAKATARSAGKPAMPAAAQKDFEAKVGLRNTLFSLISELEQNKYEPPAVAKLLTDTGAQTLVELSRRSPDTFPKVAAFQNFMSRVERTNAPERHSLYGAALTRNELPRYNITVPTYADSGKTIKKILQDRLDAVNESIALKQQMYARAGEVINLDEVKPQDFVSTFGGGPPALGGAPQQSGAPSNVMTPAQIAAERQMAFAIMTDKNEQEVRKRFKQRTGQDL